MNHRALPLLGLTVWFSACDRPTADGDSSEPPDLLTDSGSGQTSEDCQGSPPVVDDVWCVNTGIKPHYETGEDTATIRIWSAVSDVDGDLVQYSVQLFYDDVIDSTVDTSVTQFNPVHGSVDYPPCQATTAELGLTLYLTGSDPEYDTLYEWGVVVTDAYGLESDPLVDSCWTPASDGSDGGGGEPDTGS